MKRKIATCCYVLTRCPNKKKHTKESLSKKATTSRRYADRHAGRQDRIDAAQK